MADGDNTSSDVGMGMIIGLLLVLIIVIAGGFYMFAGHASSSIADAAGHTVSGSVQVK